MDKELSYAVILVTMMLFFLITLFIVLFQKSARKRTEYQLNLYKTKLLYEEELKKVSFEVTENLLQHMSSELHDNVGQLHTTMNVQLENLIIDCPNLSSRFIPLKSSLNSAILQTRSLAKSYSSESIGSIGLVSSLSLEIARIKSLKRFEVKWEVEDETTNLTKNQELMIFRIFQEIAQNTIRHASAKNFSVKLNAKNEQFELLIEDDGNGFDKNSVLRSPKTSGLSNIIRRAKLAQMLCTIDSSIGNGTHITLQKF